MPKAKRKKQSTARKLREVRQHIDVLLEACDNGDIDWMISLVRAPAPFDYTDRLRTALESMRARVEDQLRLREVNKKPGSSAGR